MNQYQYKEPLAFKLTTFSKFIGNVCEKLLKALKKQRKHMIKGEISEDKDKKSLYEHQNLFSGPKASV